MRGEGLEVPQEGSCEALDDDVVDAGVGPEVGCVHGLEFGQGPPKVRLLPSHGLDAVLPESMVETVISELGRGDRRLGQEVIQEPLNSGVESGLIRSHWEPPPPRIVPQR
jgi:hypothetical protein